MNKLGIISLGGTITMSSKGEAGALPELTAEDLCGALPQLNEMAEIYCATLQSVGSPSLTQEDLFGLADQIDAWHAEGIEAFVIMQGTDTLEETAFAIDLMFSHTNMSIVFTAAMRDPKALGSDGSANLLASARVALHSATSEMGTVVVINDEIHAARLVEKRHAFSLKAFQSPNLGPVGWVVEGRARYVAAPKRLKVDYLGGRTKSNVQLIKCVFDMGPELLDFCLGSTSIDAVVIEGVGGGNVASWLSPQIEKLAQKMPVVICSRTGGGEVLSASYGEQGSAGPLISAGCINGTTLDGLKSRMLLKVLLADGADYHRIRTAFDQAAKLYLQ